MAQKEKFELSDNQHGVFATLKVHKIEIFLALILKFVLFLY